MTDERSLAGPKVLLMGPSGTGKTYALGTLVDWAAKQTPSKEVFILFTENGLETLLGYWRDRGLEVPPNLHWHQQLVPALSLTALMEGAKKVSMLNYKALTELQDFNRANSAFEKILASCFNFPDDRTGKEFGSIEHFDTDKIFAIDGLSELSAAAMKMQVGIKPMAAPQDYGVAQQYIIGLLRLHTQALRCPYVMIAHVDRILDTVSQLNKTMVKAAGKALADEIPQLFSDVIYTVREGAEFFWDTAAYGVDTKTRSLGYRSKIKPDFGQIMDLWVKRGGK